MYLSKLILNPLNRAARRDLSNPYELHRSLMRAFPNPLPDRERVLFRIESAAASRSNHPHILVQSIALPNWEALTLMRTYLLTAPDIKDISSLSFQTHQALYFRLRANPSRRDSQSRKRIGVYDDQSRRQWMERKGKEHGFQIASEAMMIRPVSIRSFYRTVGETRQRITLNAVDFEGLLIVEDPSKFLTSLKEGIGSAKGFGFGLLSLARA